MFNKKTTIPQTERPIYQLKNFPETKMTALCGNALNGEYEPTDVIMTNRFQDFKAQI